MAKVLIQHDKDPGIAIILHEDDRLQGFHGSCTECGWPMHKWLLEKAVRAAQGHVDRHESSL